MSGRALLVALAMAWGCLVPSAGWAAWVTLSEGAGKGPAVQVEETVPGVTTVRVRLVGFERQMVDAEGTRFELISVPGTGTLRDAGQPELPVVAVPVLVEGVGEVVAVRVKTREYAGVMAAPFAPRPKRCGGGEWRFVCDTGLYAQAEPFPETWVKVRQAGTARGAAAMALEVRPFRYWPAQRRLEVAWEVEVDLGAGLLAEWGGRWWSPAFEALHRLSFVTVFKAVREGGPVRERLLVIANDAFVGELAELVEWKDRSGLAVDVVALSQVGETFEQVKGYIQSEYDNSKAPPVYVLLVGDGEGEGAVPFVPSPYNCASDFLYSTLQGDDLYSEVLVGRISAHTGEDVAVQVAKTLWYERDVEAHGESGWIPQSVCISSSEGEGSSNDDVRSDEICDLQAAGGYAPTDKLYHSTGTDLASSISEKLDEGRGYVNYLGHGDGLSWVTTVPPFSVEHVQALANEWKLPFVVDIACSNGAFDSTFGDCFAEVWMKTGAVEAERAAVAIYSSSTPTAWDEPAEMAVGMAHGLLEQGVYRWGQLAAAGRAYMFEAMPEGGLEEVCHQYVVFGDPSLLLRTKKALPLAVEHAAVLPLGGAELAVKVTQEGEAVPGATVTVAMEGEFVVAGKTGADGTASLYVTAGSVGAAALTVVAPNALPYEAELATAMPGCGVLTVVPEAANCNTLLEVTLLDADLNVDPETVETVVVSAVSKTDPVPREVVLNETGVGTGKFAGTLQLGPQSSPYKLWVQHGDKVEVTYEDGGCQGVPGVVTAEAAVDCQAPVISEVTVEAVGPKSATVKFVTDEAASAQVQVGTAKPPDESVDATGGLAHQAVLSGLTPSTEYFLGLTAVDSAGNEGTDDKGGQYYSFVTAECEPDCGGKACGPDGCGGECGSCCNGQTCQGGECVGGPGCQIEAGPGCGGCDCEECVCAMDPYCCETQWDDICVGECAESCGGCQAGPDCEGKECGDDGCGGVCGACPADWFCTDEWKCVETCDKQCEGKECGSDGCGGVCGMCTAPATCQEGACLKPCTGLTFEGCCLGQEVHYCDQGFEIVEDCKAQGKKCGWKDSMSFYACVDEQKEDPTGEFPLWCPGACPPLCEGKECGPDGCGGTCGECGQGDQCENGQCEPICKVECDGKECGDDGCGGECGVCGEEEECQAGLCESTCQPECAGRQCGEDGCGGVCGKCAPGMTCSADFACVLAEVEEDIVAPDVVEAEPESGGGGGGCSAAGGAGNGWMGLLGGLLCAVLLLGRGVRVRG